MNECRDQKREVPAVVNEGSIPVMVLVVDEHSRSTASAEHEGPIFSHSQQSTSYVYQENSLLNQGIYIRLCLCLCTLFTWFRYPKAKLKNAIFVLRHFIPHLLKARLGFDEA
jgi:hypothetical protein